MKKDERKVSEGFTKYLKLTKIVEDEKYIYYEFESRDGESIAEHYQLKPSYCKSRSAKIQANNFLSKMKKVEIGHILLAVCKCREIKEEGYKKSAIFLDVDKIIKPLTEWETKYADGIGDYILVKPITDWSKV